MKKVGAFIFIIVIFCAVESFAFLGSCINKRFDREYEFKLMYECVYGSDRYLSQSQLDEKIKSCSCYISGLICKYDSKENLEKQKTPEVDEKDVKKCMEKSNKDD